MRWWFLAIVVLHASSVSMVTQENGLRVRIGIPDESGSRGAVLSHLERQLQRCRKRDTSITRLRSQTRCLDDNPHLLQSRLRGGMGRVLTMGDKFYKKRKMAASKAKQLEEEDKEEEEEIAPKYRGLPLEQRLKMALDHPSEADEIPIEDDADQAESQREAGSDAEDGDGEALEWNTGAAQRTSGDATKATEEEVDRGFKGELVGGHRLRTQPCSGDAWPGLFFDVQAKERDVHIKALCIASALYRREPHVCVQIFYCNGTSAGKEGEAAHWELIFSGCNCSLPTVAKDEAHAAGTEPYGQLPFDAPVRVPAGGTVGFGLYTNSLCGLALRWTSDALGRADDVTKDKMGVRVGRTPAVPIVASAEEMRRNGMRGVQAGEVTDSDEHIMLRAGLCSAVTGHDHPFVETLLDRHPRNARAFVGEVVYDPAPPAG